MSFNPLKFGYFRLIFRTKVCVGVWTSAPDVPSTGGVVD